MHLMRPLCPVLLVAGALAGCGDNSKLCGPGTLDQAGVCLPAPNCGRGTIAAMDGSCVPDGTVICADGTKLDPASGFCVVDPAACQAGTVLVDGRCQDPTAGLKVDLEEGPEPNGVHLGDQPAGVIGLKAEGGPGFIVHGCINPFEDRDHDGALDPDLDRYTVAVSGPTLLGLTADGTGGLVAGFLATSDAPVLAGWQRLGVSLASTTVSRQLFLPGSGTYHLTLADGRSLLAGTPAVAAGSSQACYYVTITRLALPAPTPLSAAGATGAFAGEVAFYTVPVSVASVHVAVAMASSAAAPAVVALAGDVPLAVATGPRGGAASAALTGPRGDVTLAVDAELDLDLAPVAFDLTVTAP